MQKQFCKLHQEHQSIVCRTMLWLTKPNLESDEESPPASQLEKRHKTELTTAATQRTKRRNPSRKSPPKDTNLRQTSKRKGDEITSAIEFKRRKTEESILKLKIHLQQKTCPKSLQYKAWANITPDDIFQKEIGAIKQYAEKQFVEALLRFHQRRLERYAKKLERTKFVKHRGNKTFVSSRNESQSPSANIAKIKASKKEDTIWFVYVLRWLTRRFKKLFKVSFDVHKTVIYV